MTVTRLTMATNSIRVIFLDSNHRLQPVKLGNVGTTSAPPYQVLDASGNNILYSLNASISSQSGQPLVEYQSKSSNNSVTMSLRVYVPANTPGTDFSNGTYGEMLSYTVQFLNSGNNSNPTDGPTSGPAVSLTIPNLVMLTTASAATLDFQDFTSLTQSSTSASRAPAPSTSPSTVRIS